jgi:urease accessory protein
MEAEIELAFGARPTSFRCLRQEPPWKVVRGFSLPSGASLVHLNNISGGVFGGDRLKLSATLEAGAEAQITTTGATRVYRPRAGTADAMLQAKFVLGRDSLLDYLPDALIPYREARILQQSEFSLADDAALFYWETLAPGRTASGELFAYQRLKIASVIEAAGRPVLEDRMLLEPARWPMRTPARFGSRNYLATFVAVRAGSTTQEVARLEEALWDALESTRREGSVTLWGVSALPAHGVLVRGMLASPVSIPATLSNLWSVAKQQLCGRTAIAPRKIY